MVPVLVCGKRNLFYPPDWNTFVNLLASIDHFPLSFFQAKQYLIFRVKIRPLIIEEGMHENAMLDTKILGIITFL